MSDDGCRRDGDDDAMRRRATTFKTKFDDDHDGENEGKI